MNEAALRVWFMYLNRLTRPVEISQRVLYMLGVENDFGAEVRLGELEIHRLKGSLDLGVNFDDDAAFFHPHLKGFVFHVFEAEDGLGGGGPGE